MERSMIDLYGMGSPNVVKIYIALEELELPYTVHPIDVFGGAQFSEAFVKLNPNAKVPVIVDHEGPGGKPYTVFESGAILLYLAEKTLRLLPTDTAARYDVIQWLMVQMTGVGPMSGQLVHFVRFAPGGNEYARSRYATQVHRLLETIDARLGQVPFLGGRRRSRPHDAVRQGGCRHGGQGDGPRPIRHSLIFLRSPALVHRIAPWTHGVGLAVPAIDRYPQPRRSRTAHDQPHLAGRRVRRPETRPHRPGRLRAGRRPRASDRRRPRRS